MLEVKISIKANDSLEKERCTTVTNTCTDECVNNACLLACIVQQYFGYIFSISYMSQNDLENDFTKP